MKKAILILALGLLLSTNAYAVKLHKIKIGMSKMDFCNIFVWSTKNCANEQGVRYQKDNIEVQQAYDKFYVFNDVTRYIDKEKGGGKAFGNGTLYGIANNMSEAHQIIDEIKKKRIVEKNKKEEEKKRIAEKKKKEKEKKKPKSTPDDNKVVAAASGSGFFVSNTGHIVTNHHVIDECKAVKVNFKGDEIEAKILAIDKTNDLAILKAKINPSKVYSVSNEDVTLLQDVIVAGFPLGKKVSAAIKTHKGSVSALAGFGDNYSNFQTDATINQGNSGGPVMDHKGNIVGVAVALMSAEAGQNIFFAVKSSTLKTFANANSITFLPPNNREMSNAELGQLITEGTLFLECWMTIAKIKQIIAQEENRKAFYSEHK